MTNGASFMAQSLLPVATFGRSVSSLGEGSVTPRIAPGPHEPQPMSIDQRPGRSSAVTENLKRLLEEARHSHVCKVMQSTVGKGRMSLPPKPSKSPSALLAPLAPASRSPSSLLPLPTATKRARSASIVTHEEAKAAEPEPELPLRSKRPRGTGASLLARVESALAAVKPEEEKKKKKGPEQDADEDEAGDRTDEEEGAGEEPEGQEEEDDDVRDEDFKPPRASRGSRRASSARGGRRASISKAAQKATGSAASFSSTSAPAPSPAAASSNRRLSFGGEPRRAEEVIVFQDEVFQAEPMNDFLRTLATEHGPEAVVTMLRDAMLDGLSLSEGSCTDSCDESGSEDDDEASICSERQGGRA